MRLRTACSSLLLLCAAFAATAAFAVQPVATVSTNWKGVELDLMSVERKGNVLTLKWAVRNTSASSEGVNFALTGAHVTTYVVDEENGTKYYALTDKEGNTLATSHEYIGGDTYGISASVAAGTTNRYWAKFPAPPPEVKTVNVLFTESEPIEGAAITEK